jgi:aromatic-L-amino-acid/L-tryptophan decarboxylase
MSLDPDADELASVLVDAARVAARLYSRGLRPERPAAVPATAPWQPGPLPEAGTPLSSLTPDLASRLDAEVVASADPRFLALVPSAGNAASLVAELLATATNGNGATHALTAGASRLESEALAWLVAFIGYAPEAGGLLVSGGSLANLTALMVARDARFPEVRQHGLSGLPPLVVYGSSETHHCLQRCVQALGLGRSALRALPVDGTGSLRADSVAQALATDRANGLQPLAVVATLGTTATGAIDAIGELAALCQEEGLWLHVDAAYGGPAAAVLGPIDGLAAADSVAVDLHKWLYVPYESGCVLFRDASLLTRTFGLEPHYLADVQAGDAALDPMQRGFELSRGLRGLKFWALFRVHGANRLRQAIADNLQVAKDFGIAIDSSPYFELTTPVGLSVVCFRLRAAGELDGGVSDAWHRRLLTALHQHPEGFRLSTIRWQERLTLRLCVVNHRTEARHLADLLKVLEALAQSTAP